MILAIDTSTAACTAALFDEDGACLGRCDEPIGRGHSEHLIPLLQDLLEGRVADRIFVGVGPGSFTGIRVGVAAAHGLALGWKAELSGMSTLALIAASGGCHKPIVAAVPGGHGELFLQQFNSALDPQTDVLNLRPEHAATAVTAEIVIGPAASQLVEVRGWGQAMQAWPSAAAALELPSALRNLPPKPIYARPPDAKVGGTA